MNAQRCSPCGCPISCRVEPECRTARCMIHDVEWPCRGAVFEERCLRCGREAPPEPTRKVTRMVQPDAERGSWGTPRAWQWQYGSARDE